LVAAEIGVLELVSGASLTPDERQQAAEAVDSAMRGNRTVFLRNYAIESKVLQRVSENSARIVIVDWNQSSNRFEQQVYTRSIRQQLRYATETMTPTPGFERADAIETPIVRHHDPTVVLDSARKHIISEINLGYLYDASVWYAKTTGLPGPSADFKNHLRVWFKENYLNSNADVAAELCDEPQNFLYLTDSFKGPQHNEAAMRALRTKLEGEDQSTRDVSLAIAVSDASGTVYVKVQQALGRLKKTFAQASGAIGYGSLVQQNAEMLFGTNDAFRGRVAIRGKLDLFRLGSIY
jgi:hypothetical protein